MMPMPMIFHHYIKCHLANLTRALTAAPVQSMRWPGGRQFRALPVLGQMTKW
jgi:hypothetical protein